MKKVIFAIICASCATLAFGQKEAERTKGIVGDHILPSFEILANQSANLAQITQKDCTAGSAPLHAAYANAFDAWIAVSHLRFGPSEIDDRAYALAFWPDPRGYTPKALKALIHSKDPIIDSVEDYAEVSISARGFYALEFLIYDPVLSVEGEEHYRCDLIKIIAKDIQLLADSIYTDWKNEYAVSMLMPTLKGRYRSEEEAIQELFKALSTGLQFTSDTRLGRPLGTFDRPRPRRAEAWRSGRSSHHIAISLSALRDIAIKLAPTGSPLEHRLGLAFERALLQLANLDDPIFASVAETQTRIKVEIVQQSVDAIRKIVRDELGPELGVIAGFNAMDGD
tara:strand:+ start:1642 stop:2658 length:1017 start_codon:yes stop_codon:yes gene_type:complete